MNVNLKEDDIKEPKKFPVEIAIFLVLVNIIICLMPLTHGIYGETYSIIGARLFKGFVMMPAIFLFFGLMLKLIDRSFSLWNAFYLGLLASIMLSINTIS